MELEKTFDPKQYEERIYNTWQSAGYFNADANSGKPAYSVLFPPPNITDRLHVGHALNVTIQDLLVRFKRMQGYEALWLPGTDHAAIATEAKVVSKLAREGKKKEDLTREQFDAEIQAWYKRYGNEILEQCKMLGVSWDWSKIAFTRDEQRNKAVAEAFVRLFDKGLIYRGARITNWCPNCKTAVSDLEGVHQETQSKLYYIRYYLEQGSEYVLVATTRPETLFGDLAVAVNPTDKRFKKFVGKKLKLPLTDKTIPVIADEYVDVKFGTGALKITPSHDANDYEVGARHNLGLLNVIEKDGTLNENAGSFKGLAGTKARDAVVEALKKADLLEKEEDYLNSTAHCERCHTQVESLVTEQWFIKMEGIAAEALKAIKKQGLNIYPARQGNVLLNWIENTRDWCISRQLWSGHRIPVYTCAKCGTTWASADEPTECACGHKAIVQDPDVLDTWFSSGLWPLSTLGWPDEKSADLKKFYPFDALVTAYDIIFFWCARMIFSSSHFMDSLPFKNLIFSGIVRDKNGVKMSKNLGNGVDPAVVIKDYGADALRFALIFGISLGGDSRFSFDKVEQARKFINKVWNASRFAMMNLEGKRIMPLNEVELTLPDKWILNELNITIKRVTELQDKFDFGLALNELYEFTWNKFCDFYIEFSKPHFNAIDTNIQNGTATVLKHVLTQVLKMLHPYLPFVTEEIFSKLCEGEGDIIVSKYPTANKKYDNLQAADQMQSVMNITRELRNMRMKFNLKNSTEIPCALLIKEGATKTATDIISYLEALTNIKATIVKVAPNGQGLSKIISPHYEVYVNSASLVDGEQEVARLTQELARIDAEIAKINKSLQNPGFVARAPEQVVSEFKDNLAKLTARKISAEQALKQLDA